MNLVKGGKTSVDHAMGRPFKVPTPPKVRNLHTKIYLLLIYSKLCDSLDPPPLSFSCCGSSSHSKISTPLPFSFFQLLSSLSHFLFPCCAPVTVLLRMLFGLWIVICPVVLHLQFSFLCYFVQRILRSNFLSSSLFIFHPLIYNSYRYSPDWTSLPA